MSARATLVAVGAVVAAAIGGSALVPLTACQGARDAEADPTTLDGAGATLSEPLVRRWAARFSAEPGRARVSYRALGSGTGTRLVGEGLVDFGATEAPSAPAELPTAVSLVPVALGAVAVFANLAGRTEPVKLRPESLARVLVGEITRWDDPELVRDDADLAGLDAPILVVSRADASGSSHALTRWLARTSPTLAARIGARAHVALPIGIAERGTEALVARVAATPFSLGYADAAAVRGRAFVIAALENRAGAFVLPSPDSVRVAAEASADAADPLDAPAPGAYPLATCTFAVVPRTGHGARSVEALRFVAFAAHGGQDEVEGLGFVRLPEPLRARADRTLSEAFRARGVSWGAPP